MSVPANRKTGRSGSKLIRFLDAIRVLPSRLVSEKFSPGLGSAFHHERPRCGFAVTANTMDLPAKTCAAVSK